MKLCSARAGRGRPGDSGEINSSPRTLEFGFTVIDCLFSRFRARAERTSVSPSCLAWRIRLGPNLSRYEVNLLQKVQIGRGKILPLDDRNL